MGWCSLTMAKRKEPAVAVRRQDMLERMAQASADGEPISYAQLGKEFGVSQATAHRDVTLALIDRAKGSTVTERWLGYTLQTRMGLLMRLQQEFDAEPLQVGPITVSPDAPKIANAIDKQLTGIERLMGLHQRRPIEKPPETVDIFKEGDPRKVLFDALWGQRHDPNVARTMVALLPGEGAFDYGGDAFAAKLDAWMEGEDDDEEDPTED